MRLKVRFFLVCSISVVGVNVQEQIGTQCTDLQPVKNFMFSRSLFSNVYLRVLLNLSVLFEDEGFVSARLFVASELPILIHISEQNSVSLKN